MHRCVIHLKDHQIVESAKPKSKQSNKFARKSVGFNCAAFLGLLRLIPSRRDQMAYPRNMFLFPNKKNLCCSQISYSINLPCRQTRCQQVGNCHGSTEISCHCWWCASSQLDEYVTSFGHHRSTAVFPANYNPYLLSSLPPSEIFLF